MRNIDCFTIVDVEVGIHDHKIHDIGAFRHDGATMHSASKQELLEFIKGSRYLCGHNIVHHDIKYIFGAEYSELKQSNQNKHEQDLQGKQYSWLAVDTLYMSPLLFPERPYHKLLKDDKLITEQLNNPVNDCMKARDLLMDEIEQWNIMPRSKRIIFATLLKDKPEFEGFMDMVEAETFNGNIEQLITDVYKSKVCTNADIALMATNYPIELAYALALADTSDHRSITPGWVLCNYPQVEHVIRLLRHTPCNDGCEYCNSKFNIYSNLKKFFGYNQFRTYNDEPLQEIAVKAATEGKSLLAIFPTGGGKSLTFQLPAMMDGESVHGLTVVISPLQSLMKDQVDNLAERGYTDAVTINGMLDPISRSISIERVLNGEASLLYISPEMLRSNTVERILMSRNVVRFVIDEAHCFSAWGQDFRIDYLYIGKFIAKYQEAKRTSKPIPVSCFTATAKQKVIQDICDYFKATLGLELELYASSASRTNLHYSVIHAESNDDKYAKMRALIAEFNCPTIIYVSRTKRTADLAKRLTEDGFDALPFNGKMDADDKISNQEAFMSDKVRIIVATSAFGMGVDKKDVGLVIHYDISESLENYVQEAGRAGRDPELQAKCYVLYNDDDLDKHFMLLNQTKLSISEINQVWKAIKQLTKQREHVCCSALEIARQAGWDDSTNDIETRIKTALGTLEQCGYIERGNNVPHVYATGITVRNVDEARDKITNSSLFDKEETEKTVRIIKSLISQKNIAKAQASEAESRVDYLADILGLNKHEVISAIDRMRQEGILADSRDMSAFLPEGSSAIKATKILDNIAKLEQYIIKRIANSTLHIACKQLNDDAIKADISASTEKNIKTLLYFMVVKNYACKIENSEHHLELSLQASIDKIMQRFEKRIDICRCAIEWLFRQSASSTNEKAEDKKKNMVQFSVVELLNHIKHNAGMLFTNMKDIKLEEVEEALYYLYKINVLKLEGGFMIMYNGMKIQRLKGQNTRYKLDDYKMLNEFYKQKIQQVHIVGEYANLMVKDYNAALQFVQDYFQMDYKRFIATYFKGERANEINRNITPAQYERLFGCLSTTQMGIINDKESHCIVVAAGPGSGKTRVLVHKLASLLMLEDVKHEQLLMLTFSRAAATEFKQRLMHLIGNAAHFVEIKTFHSYSFDLIGRIGNIDEVDNVVAQAATMIASGEVEPSKIGKTVLVIDEAQDMNADDYALVKALMDSNEDMRIIAVGDDDQNIFEFRGSNSGYMQQLAKADGSKLVDMTENYRSNKHVVTAANNFAINIKNRIKSTPIVSMNNDEGHVKVVHHAYWQMFEPLVRDIVSNRNSRDTGTTCVLTHTNDEAALIVAMLRKHGIGSKLVQSMDGIRFCKLAELRYFMKFIKQGTHSPVINDDVWVDVKNKMFAQYRTSTSMVYVKVCIERYEELNKVKYMSDFEEFVYESNIEDFTPIEDTDVVVSTIHKSKGHEYNNVYMMLTAQQHIDDALYRQYYVGMTRAKQNLYIHTNGNCFDKLIADEHINDAKAYSMPSEIVLQLSHRDVNLSFFANIKSDVLALRGGDKLAFNKSDYTLCKAEDKTSNSYNVSKPLAKLSAKMQTTIDSWSKKGYEVSSGSVRFIVAWRPKDAPAGTPESAVLLADLVLSSVCKH